MNLDTPQRRRVRLVVLGAGLTLATGGLVACSGGSSGTSTGDSTPSPSAGATTAAGPAGRAGLFGSTQVQACLKAAGIAVPTGAAQRPTGTFTGRPTAPASGVPTGARPSGAGGFGNAAQSTEVRQALKACGITLPTGGAGGALPSGAAPAPTS